MGKLLNIYNTITDRIDEALKDGGSLQHFTVHYKGIDLDEQINNEVDCPFVITTVDDTFEEIQNDERNTSIDFPVVTYIKTHKASSENIYENTECETGILRDIENVIDVIKSDCNLNSNTDVPITYSGNIQKVGSNFVLASIIWRTKSLPVRFGELSD